MNLYLLKSHIQVEFKVKESKSGLYSAHDNLIQQIQIDEKLKHDKYPIKEVIDEDGIKTKYGAFSYIKIKGANHHQSIRLYEIKQGEAERMIRVDVRGCVRGKKGKKQIQLKARNLTGISS